MITINEHFQKLQAGYLFPEIGRRVSMFAKDNPDAKIIRLGIGDVTQPLPPSIIKAFHEGIDQMAESATFKGYGPEQGYSFLSQAIIDNDFSPRDVSLDTSEVFISDGSKCDSGNIQEIFGLDNVIAVSDPSYPVYVDTNVMAGRTGDCQDNGCYEGLVYMPCNAENNFNPAYPSEPVDLIYLCYPNNPTGTVATKAQLTGWVNFAKENKAIILFDAAYEAFITNPEIPHSIFEIPGAKEVAIEFRSFSKSTGFTGTRCAYTVIPKELMAYTQSGEKVSVNATWNRRHCTKFNGVSYPVQVAAAASYTTAGKAEVRALVDYYMNNAKLIKSSMEAVGYSCFGGVDSPYIWLKTPEGVNSWAFFDLLLNKINVVGTPGAGFGPAGEGYIRLSAFGDLKNVEEAMSRIAKL